MTIEEGSPAWNALRAKSAEELLRDFICPIKREFWVPPRAATDAAEEQEQEQELNESAPESAQPAPPRAGPSSWRAQKKRLQQRAARERHRRERSLWQCKAWKEGVPGSCRWGDDCLFAHGDRPGKLTRKDQQQQEGEGGEEATAANDIDVDVDVDVNGGEGKGGDAVATPLPDLLDKRCPVDAVWPGSCEFAKRGTCCWGLHGGGGGGEEEREKGDDEIGDDDNNNLDVLLSLRRRDTLLPGSASTNALTPRTRDALFSGCYDFKPSIAVLDSLGLSHGVAGGYAAKARARARAKAIRRRKEEEEEEGGGKGKEDKKEGVEDEEATGAGTGGTEAKDEEEEGGGGGGGKSDDANVGGGKGDEKKEQQQQQRRRHLHLDKASTSDNDVEEGEEEDSGTVFYRETRPTARESKPLDLRGKLYLAPLTTVGNLPFRALAVSLGADVTCSEMALATNLLRGHKQEWALLRRHASERVFGVQIAGGHADALARATQLVRDATDADFVDVNMGCPIDLVAHKGAGAGLLARPKKVEALVKAVAGVAERCSNDDDDDDKKDGGGNGNGNGKRTLFPVTVKVRKGVRDGADSVHSWLPTLARGEWGRAVSAVTIHGRSKQQRYSRDSDWKYVGECARLCAEAADVDAYDDDDDDDDDADAAETENPRRFQVVSSGDVASWQEYERLKGSEREIAGVMLARGALVKPWLFTEIKERRDIDLRSSERLELYKRFCSLGLSHWGSDPKGVETTRRFFLEWMGFAHRYVPVGLIEEGALRRDAERAAAAASAAASAAATSSENTTTSSSSNWSTTSLSARRVLRLRAPRYRGRDDLETLLASEDPKDWIRVSEMAIGTKAPPGFRFEPKHKSNAYSASAALDGDE